MARACCEEMSACRATPCGDLDACVDTCPPGDEACRQECRDGHPAAFGPGYAELASCKAASCQVECGLSCGGYEYPTAECGDCAAENPACCDAARACTASEACLALSFCTRRCSRSDHQCFGDCERLHREGLELARALGDCLAVVCDHQCYDGPDWTCPGDAEPQGPALVEIGVYIAYLVESGPVEGAHVRACPLPSDCSSAVERTTDAGGHVTLEVPEGFAGVLRIAGAGLDLDVLLGAPVHPNQPVYIFAFTMGAFVERFRHLLQLDPEQGQLAVSVVDCDGAQPGGISFSVDAAAAAASPLPFYGALGEQLGDETRTGDAFAVFLNLDEGEYRFEAQGASDTCLVGRDVYVGAGRITQATELAKGCWR